MDKFSAVTAAPPAESQPQGISGDLERFDFFDPALVVPWLAVIYSEFLPDEDNLGRRSDIEMRAALDYAMKFVAGHRQCQPDWFQKQALEAYSLLFAEGWEWNAQHGWTRHPIAAPGGVDMLALEQARAYLAGRYGEHDGWAKAISNAAAALRSQGQADAVVLVEAAKAIKFDIYHLTTPDMRAAFDGREAIAVVQQETIKRFVAALAQQVPADGELREALAQIADKSVALRSGGPAPEDLQELSDALEECCGIASDALAATTQAPQPVVGSFTPEGLFTPGTDGNLIHEVGSQMVQDTYLNGVLLSRIPFASQPQQEAVAWRYKPYSDFAAVHLTDDPKIAASAKANGWWIEDLYTTIGQQGVDDAVLRYNRILMRLDWLERGETIDMDEFRADVTAALAAHGKPNG